MNTDAGSIHEFVGSITVTGAGGAIIVETKGCETTPHGLGHAIAVLLLTFTKDEKLSDVDLRAFHLNVLMGIRCGLARSEKVTPQQRH